MARMISAAAMKPVLRKRWQTPMGRLPQNRPRELQRPRSNPRPFALAVCFGGLLMSATRLAPRGDSYWQRDLSRSALP